MLTVVGSGAVTASASALTAPEFTTAEQTAVLNAKGIQIVAHEGAFAVTCKKGLGNYTQPYVNRKEQFATKGDEEFNNCTTNLAGTCTSPGATPGHIIPEDDTERLFYLSSANHEAGVILNWSWTGERRRG